MSEMHFHDTAVCVWCRYRVTFRTPIANLLTQGSQCRVCHEPAMVGIRDDVLCTDCRADWAASVERLNGWGTASRA